MSAYAKAATDDYRATALQEIERRLADYEKMRQDVERLRALIKSAHTALTKGSLTPEERVYDAVLALSREI